MVDASRVPAQRTQVLSQRDRTALQAAAERVQALSQRDRTTMWVCAIRVQVLSSRKQAEEVMYGLPLVGVMR